MVPDLQGRLESLRRAALQRQAEGIPLRDPPPPPPYDEEARRELLQRRLEAFDVSVGPELAGAERSQLDSLEKKRFLDRWNGRCNAVLSGPWGVGKSFTAVAMARRQITAGRAARWEPSGLLLNIEDLVTREQRLQRAARAEVLLLDGLGDRPLTDARMGMVLDLLDHRWRHQLPTIVTTNHPVGRPKGYKGVVLSDRIGGAATDRVLDGAHGIWLDGPSRRTPGK